MKQFKMILSSLLAAALLLGLPCFGGKAEAAGSAAINETNFPDAAFRSFVSSQYDKDGDGVLNAAELAEVTDMDCGWQGIASLKGIEHFSSLQSLNCYHNELRTLDLRGNPLLSEVCCNENQLESLNLSGNPSLQVLHCYDNCLTELNLSGNAKLTSLWCFGNQLSELDLSKNTALTSLDCSCNQFTSLNLTKNTALTELLCDENQLISLDLSKNAALTDLYCTRNNLRALNLSANPALIRLSCAENRLNALNLSANTALEMLSCDGNPLTTLDLCGHAALTSLVCAGCGLTSVSLIGCSRLNSLDCADNAMQLLDLTPCPTLCTLLTDGESWDDGEGHLGYYGDEGFLFADADLPIAYSEAPLFFTQPQSVTAAPGVHLEFHADVYSKSDFTLQWQYRTGASGAWNDCTGEGSRSATYELVAKDYRNGYQYRCKATNAAGSSCSSHAVLTVRPIPVITEQPKSVSASSGSFASFHITAKGEDLSYRWQYRTSANGAWNNCSGEGCDTDTLRVEAKNYRDGYQYRCKVSNGYGSETSGAATLSLLKAPSITAQPLSQTEVAGKTVVFRVSASGDGLRYQWQYRTSAAGAWNNCSSGTAASLSVEAKNYRDGYQYRCKVTNAAGTAYSSAAKLSVLTVPSITSQPVSRTAAVGTTVQFAVKASGGALTYQWQFRSSSSANWSSCSAADAKTATMSVEAKSYRNGYQYRCLVKNAAGEVYSNTVTLSVKK